LFKDLLTKTEGQAWFKKAKNGNGRVAYLLLREHYVGEAHDQRDALPVPSGNLRTSTGRMNCPSHLKNT
jgi:hypothetical protein